MQKFHKQVKIKLKSKTFFSILIFIDFIIGACLYKHGCQTCKITAINQAHILPTEAKKKKTKLDKLA